MGRQKNFGLRSAEKKEIYPYFCEHRAERYFWEKPILFLFLIQISRADTNSDIYTTKTVIQTVKNPNRAKYPDTS